MTLFEWADIAFVEIKLRREAGGQWWVEIGKDSHGHPFRGMVEDEHDITIGGGLAHGKTQEMALQRLCDSFKSGDSVARFGVSGESNRCHIGIPRTVTP